MKLVICEKPSVGAAVAAALGVTGKKDGYIENDKYIISWCIGHSKHRKRVPTSVKSLPLM